VGNSKWRGIIGNAGPHQGEGKEGGPAAFVGGEAHLMVADRLTATLQLWGMAMDVRRRTIKGKGEARWL
jgi:hypothetical protein